jgi:hypothetical protein
VRRLASTPVWLSEDGKRGRRSEHFEDGRKSQNGRKEESDFANLRPHFTPLLTWPAPTAIIPPVLQ